MPIKPLEASCLWYEGAHLRCYLAEKFKDKACVICPYEQKEELVTSLLYHFLFSSSFYEAHCFWFFFTASSLKFNVWSVA